MRAWWTVAFVGAVAACGSPATEGQNPGECEDLADNDADGFFDCDDNGCWGAPTCAGAGTTDTDGGGHDQTTDDDGGGGGGGDTDTTEETDTDSEPVVTGDGVNARFKSVSLTYQLDVSWDAQGETICGNYFDTSTGECDCTAVFHGEGVLSEVAETRNQYIGTWTRVSSNCASAPESQGSIVSGMSIDEASVFVPESGESYHTFRFSPDGTQGLQWVAHEDPSADTPCRTAGCPSAIDLGHFWIIFGRYERLEATDPEIDPETLRMDYLEQGPFMIPEAGLTMVLRHQLAVQFDETFTAPEFPQVLDP